MLAKNFRVLTGPVSLLTDGKIVTQHLDQLREDYATNVNEPSSIADRDDDAPSHRTDQHLPADTNKLRHSKCDKHPPQCFCD